MSFSPRKINQLAISFTNISWRLCPWNQYSINNLISVKCFFLKLSRTFALLYIHFTDNFTVSYSFKLVSFSRKTKGNIHCKIKLIKGVNFDDKSLKNICLSWHQSTAHKFKQRSVTVKGARPHTNRRRSYTSATESLLRLGCTISLAGDRVGSML